MNFSQLSAEISLACKSEITNVGVKNLFFASKMNHMKWHDILAIGKTMERNGSKHHIVGMTLSTEVKLYIIESYTESKIKPRKTINNQRNIQKESDQNSYSYMNCSCISFGSNHFEVQGSSDDPLAYNNDETKQLFFDMMNAGWSVPEWLDDIEWDNLILITLIISNIEKLPDYFPEMPITITHRPNSIKHILEKTITLTVGKSRTISFIDSYGDEVKCHINNVTLIDIWQKTEDDFKDPRYAEQVPPERLKELKEIRYKALEQNCPKGMYFACIEYECSKDLQLVFYTKSFLKSSPISHDRSSYFMMFRSKPDKANGTHSLPLKSHMIQSPILPDTTKIPTELFLYYEKISEWTETVL